MFKKKRFKVEISMKSGNVITVKVKDYKTAYNECGELDNVTFTDPNAEFIKVEFNEMDAILVTKCY